MELTVSELNECLNKWEEALKKAMLPEWNELPEISLYMDQVLILMNKYLSLYCDNGNSDKIITASIINNYVKMKVIPSPQKKKYSKIHLIYLIMVCILKQCLSISTIKTLIPLDLQEKKLKSFYEIFRKNEKEIAEEIVTKIKAITSKSEENDELLINEIIIKSALKANAFKYFTERIAEINAPSPETKDKDK